ncbi:Sushi, von Willebrand factor type A, EGF and pentraxin domain-containing protein 1 [Geodia barretti]|uniref:Sushi, von Willebrand factor type A, EGF and pentraxin domain-containing protein 1 n=1 Tax=Geodia barretti TaxID=519541 RepID=A0AA35S6E5_GEOBA|nr:Sushi, von Willebrand factor type A, EGF and pentraxin domain-containing protein 1 [Geodia barretti]
MEAGCRAPSSPVNGSIEEYRSTEEGAEIQFHCHDGYTPNGWMSSQCLNSSWSPHPMDLVCVLTPPPKPQNKNCSLRDLSPSLVEENRVCGSVSGGGVCYSGDSVGSVAVYFCDDGYSIEGDTTRECLSSGLWNGTTPQCVEAEECICDDIGSCSGVNEPAVVGSTVCSIAIGVLLGVVGLYLIQRVRGQDVWPHLLLSPSPPSTSHL